MGRGNRQTIEARRQTAAGRLAMSLGVAALLLAPGSRADPDDVVILSAGSSYDASAAEDDADRLIRYFSPEALADLAAPVALYPDDLLAIVLPASTQPQQIIAAADLLERRQHDPAAAPDETWDPAVIALLNYPEVLEKLHGDLRWTRDLGEAFRSQETELLAAISGFREAAYAAGNLRSDYRLRVDRQHGAIAIRPAHPQVLYVPYYDASRVIVRQTRQVYHFYPRPYPVYYYPYAAGYPFAFDDFWGVRSRYHIGWRERHLFLTRSHVETLRYHAGTPSVRTWAPRRPPPAYLPPERQRPRGVPANPRHPGRDLAENPRHPGRNLALYPRHPGRADVSERHPGGRHGLHEFERRRLQRRPRQRAAAPRPAGLIAARLRTTARRRPNTRGPAAAPPAPCAAACWSRARSIPAASGALTSPR